MQLGQTVQIRSYWADMHETNHDRYSDQLVLCMETKSTHRVQTSTRALYWIISCGHRSTRRL